MGRLKRDPKTGLVGWEEDFCVLVAKGLHVAEAYRQSCPRVAKMSPARVYNRATDLYAQERIKRRISALQDERRRSGFYRLQDAMRELDEALELARGKRDARTMATIVAIRAKMHGLMTEERKNNLNPINELDDNQLDALIQKAQSELGSFSFPEHVTKQ